MTTTTTKKKTKAETARASSEPLEATPKPATVAEEFPEREPSLKAIEEDLLGGFPIPTKEAQWLFEKFKAAFLAEQDAVRQRDELAKKFEELRKLASDNSKTLARCREVLMNWLAMRGSSSLEIFQSTQGLANATVKILNE